MNSIWSFFQIPRLFAIQEAAHLWMNRAGQWLTSTIARRCRVSTKKEVMIC